MSNETPTSVAHCTMSSLQLTSGLDVPVTSPNETTKQSSPPPPDSMDAILRGDLDCNKYTELLSAEDNINVLDDSAEIAQLPVATSLTPDVLRRMYAESWSQKHALVASLADAEQTCQDWEGALRQILGEAAVQEISQAHPVVDVDEADTVKGQYLTAISRVRMIDFCLSRRGGN